MRLTLLIFFIFGIFSSSFGQPSQQSIKWQNKSRKFIVYTPPNYSTTEQLPLIIDMHAFTGTGAGQMIYSKFNRLADRERCIVVYPYGIQGRWNTGPNFGITSNIDDVGFINILIDYMSILYNIDASKVLATGYSAGGFMSYKLACELTNRISAIAPVAASMHPNTYNDCTPDRPFPMVIFNSVNDPVTRYNGFEGVTPVDDVIEFWSNFNGCTLPTITAVPNISTNDRSTADEIAYNNCDDTEFIFYKFYNAGHTWPGAQNLAILGNTNQDISATQRAWDFLNDHPIPNDVICEKPINLETIINGSGITLQWDDVADIDYYNVLVVYPNNEKEYFENINQNSLNLNLSQSGELKWLVRAECQSGHVDWSATQSDQISLRVASSIDIFPNPPQNELTISVKQDKVGQVYEIFNSMGLVVSGQITNSRTQVDVSQLTSGIYQVRIQGELGFKSLFIQ